VQVNSRDAAAGAIFLALGGLFALGALGLELGSAFRMGPGFFPLVLASVLMGLGVLSMAGSLNAPSRPLTDVPWRGLILIVSAPVVFGLTVRGLGLLPSIALVVAIASFASRKMSVRLALALTAGLTLFCVLVFGIGLKLPIPLLGPWLAD
jgi:hypothetical protein